jgi:hypothetical protein
MWNEAVLAYFKVLSQHLASGTQENHENLRYPVISKTYACFGGYSSIEIFMRWWGEIF